MDSATEHYLRPQVFQEAFGREVIEMVKRVNYQKHLTIAQDERMLADPSHEYASWNQVSSRALEELGLAQTKEGSKGFTIQDSFMGEDWNELLAEDVKRMKSEGLLLDTGAAATAEAAEAATATAPLPEGHIQVVKAHSGLKMRYLNEQECQQEYPAISELLQQLHALPYEINQKSTTHLCKAFPHSTALFSLKKGLSQPWRLDCGTGTKDNGFKLTCVYFLPHESSDGMDGSFYLCVKDTTESVRALADRLVLFRSQAVLNRMTAVKNRDLDYVIFWIHGSSL